MKTSKDIYNIGTEIKHYEKEPHFATYISTNNCFFANLINDIPIIKYKDKSGSGLFESNFH